MLPALLEVEGVSVTLGVEAPGHMTIAIGVPVALALTQLDSEGGRLTTGVGIKVSAPVLGKGRALADSVSAALVLDVSESDSDGPGLALGMLLATMVPVTGNGESLPATVPGTAVTEPLVAVLVVPVVA